MKDVPLRLDKMFTHGRFRKVKLKPSEKLTIQKGYAAMVLTGKIYHINTIASVIKKFGTAAQGAPYPFLSTIPAATATGHYPIFNTATSESQAQWQPLFLMEDDYITLLGHNSSYIELEYLEWEVS